MNVNAKILVKSDQHFFEGLVALLASICCWHPLHAVRILDCGLLPSQREKLICAGFEILSTPGLADFSIAPEMASYYTTAVFGLLAAPDSLAEITVHIDADCLLLAPLDGMLSCFSDDGPGLAAVPDYPSLGLDFQIGNKVGIVDEIRSIIPNLVLETTSFNGGVFCLKRDYFFKNLKSTVEKLIPYHDMLWGNEMAILNLAAFVASPSYPYQVLDHSFNHRPSYRRAPEIRSVKIEKWQDRLPVLQGHFGRVNILHFVGKDKPWKFSEESSDAFKTWHFFRKMGETRLGL